MTRYVVTLNSKDLSGKLLPFFKGDKGNTGDLTPELTQARDDAVASKLAAEAAADRAQVNRPIFVLALGQSNMRNFFASNGGDETIEPGVFMWDTDSTDNAALVAGTTYHPATWGVAPLNITNGALRSQSLALHIANNLKRMTGREVYVVQIAAGGHSVEAFIPPVSLAANGWTLPVGDQDLSALLYPGLRTALDAAPGMPTHFDALVWHQGEANSLDGVDMYARKLQVMYDALAAAGVVDTTLTAFIAGELGQTSANTHLVRHTYALKRMAATYPNFRAVSSVGIPMLGGGNLHFSGPGVVQFARRYAEAYFETAKPRDFQAETPLLGTDYGKLWLTYSNSGADVDRAPIPLTSVTAAFDPASPLGPAFHNPANTTNLFYTRRLFRVPSNRLIRISYEIQVDDPAGSVDHRAVVYQYDKFKTGIGALVSTPASSPASGSDGRIFVSRTYQRFGVALGADTTLADGCEWVALGLNLGVGGDDEAYWWNPLEFSA